MTKLLSASIALSAVLTLACGEADSAEPRAAAAGRPGATRPRQRRPCAREHSDGHCRRPAGQRARRRDARVQEAHRRLHEDSQRGRGQGPEPEEDRRSARRSPIARRRSADMIMTLRAGAQARRDLRARVPAVLHQDRPGRLQGPLGRRSQGARQRAAQEHEGRHQHRLSDDAAARDVSAGAAAQAARIFRPSSNTASSDAA